MPENEEIRIGVYTCYCGGNISDTVDCERVAQELLTLPNVVVSRTNMSMCSDIGQAMIEEDIREHGINRVVIGACAPSLHEQTFRGTLSRAGLNPYLYYHVGIREQASWVHKDSPDGATEKVINLMSAGVAKARLLVPLQPIRLDAEQHALVIGGGIAGLRAAWDIARRGIKVTLIEKSPFLGGHMAQLEAVYPTEQMARDILHDLIEKILSHPDITVLTGAEVTSIQGYVGDYHVQICRQARGVTDEPAAVEAIMEACPVEVPDEFNLGLTTRKAIYHAYPGCYPAISAIDWQNCTLCGKCREMDSQNISLDNTSETVELTVGAIVVATGFKLYEPREGEFGYGQFPEVMSLAQLIRLLALVEEGDELEWNGHSVQNIALIHCVGSRQVPSVHEPQPDGEVNTYCSRVCCTATLHMANELRERFPQANIYDIYEDIRTYGRDHEAYYIRASEDMVRFLRFHANEPPEVTVDPQGTLLVRLKDYLTWGEEIDVPADLVVLATGMMPATIDELMNLLKISPGTDRFLREVHPKLRPVETAVPGVILAGTAQGPMTIQESCAAASAAAAKVAVLLAQGVVELEPFVAHVDLERCDGTGKCVEVCCYEEAISLQTISLNGREVKKAVVTPANCTGCGICVSVCPNRAINVQGWTLEQFEAMIDAIAGIPPTLGVGE